MSRMSSDEYDAKGRLINGYDYQNQCWVKNGIIQDCNHPESMKVYCQCYGKIHAGEVSHND